MRRVQLAGHRPIVLIGGGTGLIGDPSGKGGERQLNPTEQVAAWADRLKGQVTRFLEFGTGPADAVLADNYEWHYGYTATFGLATMNPKTYDRELKPSARKFAEWIRTRPTVGAVSTMPTSNDE